MKIKKLHIKNYKNLDADLIHNSDLIAFIGNNGSGKSNLLEAISHIFRSLYKSAYKVDFDYTIEYETSKLSNARKYRAKKGLSLFRNSPNLYPTLSHLVPWHFGQGGSVSVLSSNLITSLHFLHLYKPFPGFSPVVYIINRFIKNKNRFQHKGLKTYPIIYCSLFADLQQCLKDSNCLSDLYHLLTGACCGQFPNPLVYFYHKKAYTLDCPIYLSCKDRGLCHAFFALSPRLRLSFVDTS